MHSSLTTVRTVAGGLALAAWLMLETWIPWAKSFTSSEPSHAFWQAINAMSKTIGTAIPVGAAFTAVHLLLCLAAGLLLSSLAYPTLERGLANAATGFKTVWQARFCKPRAKDVQGVGIRSAAR